MLLSVLSSPTASWSRCLWRFKVLILFSIIWSVWNIRRSRRQQPPLLLPFDVELRTLQRESSAVVQTLNASASTIATASKSSTLSDDEWKSLLDMFRYMVQESGRTLRARDEDEWLPVVIRSNGTMLLKKEHLQMVREFQRFRLFAPMVYSAMNFDTEKAERLSFNFTTQRARTNVHLPLVVERHSVPLILAFGDMRNCVNLTFPRLSWCTVPENEPCRAIPIPGYNLYLERHGHSANASHFYSTMETKYPWSSKLRKAVWRGAATGFAPSGTWDSLPRARLVNYSIHHPNWFDAAFTGFIEFAERYDGEGSKLRLNSRLARQIPMDDYQKFRAVVDMDGNAWSARFGSLLCMNSVVIKVKANNKNYFDDELKPWVHFIPVKSDLSDLIETIQFAVADRHTKIVKSIIFRANEWCRTKLTQQNMVIETFWRLNSYIDLLGNDPKRWRQWDTLLESFERRGELVVVSSSEFGFRNDTSWLYQPLSEPLQDPIKTTYTTSSWVSKTVTAAFNMLKGRYNDNAFSNSSSREAKRRNNHLLNL